MKDKDTMDKTRLQILRHSAAHLLAQAILELYPGTILTIGPATEEGFFYDILPLHNFQEEDLEIIEAKMHELSKKNYVLTHKEISKVEAREIFKNNNFKLELINNIPGEVVGLSKQGDFIDLCRGGHVEKTGDIKYFKLLGLSGSYWRADKNNTQLQRVHGTAFLSKEDLENYESMKEEALKYDHRKIGKHQELFSFHTEGPGFPFFHPKGQTVINSLVSYMRKLHVEYNYKEIATPTMLNADLWQRSGHYEHYKENMYFSFIEDGSYAIKPMNCPGSFLVYKTYPKSYRELPLKLAEFGHVHRHELSGVLHGLFRVRAFTQDDAHIFCTIEQITEQIVDILNIAFKVLKKCDFTDFQLALSTRPDKALGSTELWDRAIKALKDALEQFGMPYIIKDKEGAFYGPKIEIMIKDSIGRQWQCGTAQVDFFQADNFDLTYVATTGTHERPVIIHQAIYGSLERFFGILLEHYKGILPIWLAPTQAILLPITDNQDEYALNIYNILKQNNLRIEIDMSSDPLSGKIKRAQLAKIPWMIVIGQKEVDNNSITLRQLDGKQEFNLSIDNLLLRVQNINK